MATKRGHPAKESTQELPGEDAPFVNKLKYFIDDSDEFRGVLGWSVDGESFAILKRDVFQSQVLPLHFGGVKFTSFMKRLFRYGFRTRQVHTLDRQDTAIFHPYFHRDKPELLHLVSPVVARAMKSSSKTAASVGVSGNTLLQEEAECPEKVVKRRKIYSSRPQPLAIAHFLPMKDGFVYGGGDKLHESDEKKQSFESGQTTRKAEQATEKCIEGRSPPTEEMFGPNEVESSSNTDDASEAKTCQERTTPSASSGRELHAKIQHDHKATNSGSQGGPKLHLGYVVPDISNLLKQSLEVTHTMQHAPLEKHRDESVLLAAASHQQHITTQNIIRAANHKANLSIAVQQLLLFKAACRSVGQSQQMPVLCNEPRTTLSNSYHQQLLQRLLDKVLQTPNLALEIMEREVATNLLKESASLSPINLFPAVLLPLLQGGAAIPLLPGLSPAVLSLVKLLVAKCLTE